MRVRIIREMLLAGMRRGDGIAPVCNECGRSLVDSWCVQRGSTYRHIWCCLVSIFRHEKEKGDE